MIARFLAATALILPAVAVASSEAVVTMMPPSDTLPAPTRPNDAIVVAIVGGYGGKTEKTEIVWKRYDQATGTIHMLPKKGDTSANTLRLYYDPRKKGDGAPDEAVFVATVPAGDYVLTADLRGIFKMTQFCLGAPVMHVAAGSATYLGTYRSYSNVTIEGSSDRRALGWEGDLIKAKRTLEKFPAISNRLVAADTRNGATFDCIGGPATRRTAYAIPGMPTIQAGVDLPSQR